MSEPTDVERIQVATKAFRVYCDCGDVTGAYDDVCHHDADAVENLALALTLATQRAEAAERRANRWAEKATKYVGRLQAAEAERDGYKAQRDEMDRVWNQDISHLAVVEAARDALRKACALFVEWLDREDAGSGITHEERGTPEGEAKFHAWYIANIDLCRASVDAAKAALAVPPTTEGM